mmetsp:Transcript_823/g.2081  ORF Transcript_823/g.2081 Transcript_823/m.2081 type:complete len:243 (+) Transcript_823:340-1068(+)
MVAWCVCKALRLSKSFACLPWAVLSFACCSLSAFNSLACLSAESPTRPSKYSIRSGKVAWRSWVCRKAARSVACASCAALRARNSFAWLSAESPNNFSTYCMRSSTVARWPCKSFSCLPWASRTPCASLAALSAASPMDFSRPATRSAKDLWRSVARPAVSPRCRSWASRNACNSWACLSADSPNNCSTYARRSPRLAWCAWASEASLACLPKASACFACADFTAASSCACLSAESPRHVSR